MIAFKFKPGQSWGSIFGSWLCCSVGDLVLPWQIKEAEDSLMQKDAKAKMHSGCVRTTCREAED